MFGQAREDRHWLDPTRSLGRIRPMKWKDRPSCALEEAGTALRRVAEMPRPRHSCRTVGYSRPHGMEGRLRGSKPPTAFLTGLLMLLMGACTDEPSGPVVADFVGSQQQVSRYAGEAPLSIGGWEQFKPQCSPVHGRGAAPDSSLLALLPRLLGIAYRSHASDRPAS